MICLWSVVVRYASPSLLCSDVVELDVTFHRFYFREVIWTVGFKERPFS